MEQDRGRQYSFFAFLSRMKHIYRWSLMRNVNPENIQEHSLQVAVIAHALALIKNRYFGGSVNPERVAVIAMFHDCNETITGDLPTPIKYYNRESAQHTVTLKWFRGKNFYPCSRKTWPDSTGPSCFMMRTPRRAES